MLVLTFQGCVWKDPDVEDGSGRIALVFWLVRECLQATFVG